MKISANELHLLPEYSGVYFLFAGDRLIYIGMSKNLRKRIKESRLIDEFLIYGVITDIQYFMHEYERPLMLLEEDLIEMFNPIGNVVHNKNKPYHEIANYKKRMAAVEAWRTPKKEERIYNPVPWWKAN